MQESSGAPTCLFCSQGRIQCSTLILCQEGLGAEALETTARSSKVAAALPRRVLTKLARFELLPAYFPIALPQSGVDFVSIQASKLEATRPCKERLTCDCLLVESLSACGFGTGDIRLCSVAFVQSSEVRCLAR